MALSAAAEQLVAEITGEQVKLGDLKKRAKVIKTDHGLATELWSTKAYYPRLLSVLILDKKRLTEDDLSQLAEDMLADHDEWERNYLSDWLLANQLNKDKKLSALMATWQNHSSPVFRRLFWYAQARLRWMGKTPPENSGALLDALEKDMEGAESEVQWTMNFCAAQIGIHEPQFRDRCVTLGERLGLYKDEKGSKNCTPLYLPEFIRIEVAKREA